MIIDPSHFNWVDPMAKSKASVEVDLWARDKDTKRSVNVPTKTEFVATDILLGDGNAEVGRGISMRMAGGDFNAIVLGTTAEVKIRCNQDDDTIQQAFNTCIKLANQAIKDYEPKMKRVLENLVKERS